mmetsp:Transcript_9658/g.16976  ORF Transcript_9658/g.16976 Transcript_9658/m.16976 type:complete len:428 (-) Transcript_9658:164-1447(-)
MFCWPLFLVGKTAGRAFVLASYLLTLGGVSAFSNNTVQKFPMPSHETRVGVGAHTLTNKAVHVELTTEACVLRLIKVVWKNDFHESFLAVHLKGFAVGGPRNDGLVLGVRFTVLEETVQLARKVVFRNGTSSDRWNASRGGSHRSGIGMSRSNGESCLRLGRGRSWGHAVQEEGIQDILLGRSVSRLEEGFEEGNVVLIEDVSRGLRHRKGFVGRRSRERQRSRVEGSKGSGGEHGSDGTLVRVLSTGRRLRSRGFFVFECLFGFHVPSKAQVDVHLVLRRDDALVGGFLRVAGCGDRLSLDLFAELGEALHAVLVCVASLLRSMMHSLEAVDVQLALKGLVFCLVEILRHDLFGKARRIKNLEGLTSGQPTDYVVKAHEFAVGQHSVQLHGERGRGSRRSRVVTAVRDSGTISSTSVTHTRSAIAV